MIQAIVQRLRRHGLASTMTYSLGRFSTVRQFYGRSIGTLQGLGAVPGLKRAGDASIFPGEDAQRIVRDMRRQSAAFGLRLPSAMVAELSAFALAARLRDWTTLREIDPNEVVNGKLSNGSPVFVADVLGVDLQPTALRIARDPLLLDAVAQYLGYVPVGVDIRMLRSFIVEGAPVEQRRQFQTIDYHFDVHAYNFVYANFYISEVDSASGAHEMVLGSHEDKPARWLLGSARRSDDEILSHYGAERVRRIEGPAGIGFVQDSSCYHRVLAPTERERIMLHLRYF